ncbi:MAG: putative Ig domain-containing protein [Candidatus Zixiibacteriota bacterium]|nr:MAG: putative Ig domain-containing protein [candidate division Zixibacteria bacterium]
MRHLLIQLVLAILLLPNLLADENEPVQNEHRDATPSEVHRILSEAKTRALAARLEFAAAAAKAVSIYDQADYDVRHYDINLTVDVAGKRLAGLVTLTAEVVSDEISNIEVDLFSNMIVSSVYGASGPLSFTRNGDRIIIGLDRTYAAGETFSISIEYDGSPIPSGLYGFVFDVNSYGNDVVASLSQPMSARSWWPCKDRPDDKADSLDMSITCDEEYYCVSNGTLTGMIINGDGTRTFNYRIRYPVATYLFSIAIADYAIWTDWYYHGANDSMPIINCVYPENLDLSLAAYAIVPEVIDVFTNLFGEYPFINEKYGHVNFEWVGALEHQTVASMTGNAFGFNEYVIIHELAHQWWGDMITCQNWHETWLNEGFATYSEALFIECRDGKPAYHDYIASLYTYFEQRTVYVYDTSDLGEIFNSVVYDKGAWVLHMLRRVVGDSTFFEILRDYYNSTHKYGSATTEDFRNICENASAMELDYFFDEWVYNPYFPHYHWSYFVEPDPGGEGYHTYIHLRQGASTIFQVFSMPIDLALSYDQILDTIVVFNNCEDTVYVLKTDENPTGIELDPDNWIMKWNRPEDWSYQQIPFGLGNGAVNKPYLDSIVARGGSGNNRYEIASGTLPPGLELDNLSGHITGTPTVIGRYDFEVYTFLTDDTLSDIQEYSLTILSCGDPNGDMAVNILDAAFIINYLYRNGPEPEPGDVADADGDGNINILDVAYIVNYLYKNGPEPIC